jgi:hypothetical protein
VLAALAAVLLSSCGEQYKKEKSQAEAEELHRLRVETDLSLAESGFEEAYKGMEELHVEEQKAAENSSLSEQMIADALAKKQQLLLIVNDAKQKYLGLLCEDTGKDLQPYIDALQAFENWLLQNKSILEAAQQLSFGAGGIDAARSMFTAAWPGLEDLYGAVSTQYVFAKQNGSSSPQ